MSDYKAYTLEESTELIVTLAKENKKLLIIGHRNPDGDSVGSAFALKTVYEGLGGKADCIFPNSVPSYLGFLTEGRELKELPKDFDSIICVDTASPSQMGDLERLQNKVDLSIDHHEFNTPYCPSFTDPTASAVGELIFKIYKILREKKLIEESPYACRCLYCAISSDTGSFMHSNVTKSALSIAGELLEIINADKAGEQCWELSRRLHSIRTVNALNAQKLAIEQLKTENSGKIAYIVLTRAMIEKSGLNDDDFGTVIDIPRNLEGALVAFVLKENGKKDEMGNSNYKISSRSNCAVSVAEICKMFSGGGHEKAAGGSIFAANEKEAEKAVIEQFKKAVEEYESKTEKVEK